jgi:hypothetical protein
LPRNAPDEPEASRGWWRDHATVLAVAGLLLTLIFNTIGVWAQFVQARRDTDQARETRLYTQIGVLTQLGNELRSTQRLIDGSKLLKLFCDPDYHGSDLSRAAEAVLREGLGVYDFMAWLFNNEYIPRDVLPNWAPRMIGAAQMGAVLTSKQELSADFPQLDAFYRDADRKLWPPDPCPQVPPGTDGP